MTSTSKCEAFSPAGSEKRTVVGVGGERSGCECCSSFLFVGRTLGPRWRAVGLHPWQGCNPACRVDCPCGETAACLLPSREGAWCSADIRIAQSSTESTGFPDEKKTPPFHYSTQAGNSPKMPRFPRPRREKFLPLARISTPSCLPASAPLIFSRFATWKTQRGHRSHSVLAADVAAE